MVNGVTMELMKPDSKPSSATPCAPIQKLISVDPYL